MSKKHILNKVAAILKKQARNTATGMCFSIYLDDDEPEVYKTRGYKPNDNQFTPTQTYKGETND